MLHTYLNGAVNSVNASLLLSILLSNRYSYNFLHKLDSDGFFSINHFLGGVVTHSMELLQHILTPSKSYYSTLGFLMENPTARLLESETASQISTCSFDQM